MRQGGLLQAYIGSRAWSIMGYMPASPEIAANEHTASPEKRGAKAAASVREVDETLRETLGQRGGAFSTGLATAAVGLVVGELPGAVLGAIIGGALGWFGLKSPSRPL